MHDPLVVAFEIRRPWPNRDHSHDTKLGQTAVGLHVYWLRCDEPEHAWSIGCLTPSVTKPQTAVGR